MDVPYLHFVVVFFLSRSISQPTEPISREKIEPIQGQKKCTPKNVLEIHHSNQTLTTVYHPSTQCRQIQY